MSDSIQWWLGDLASNFEESKNVLEGLDLNAENRLSGEIRNHLSENPSGPGHGFDHHQRVREFTTIITAANGYDIESIKTCRYAALLHDLLKEPGRGGKGPHNWAKLRQLTIELMDRARIEDRYVPRVINAIEEHHEDNPLKRSGDGNSLYEGDTVDITFLPRCFDVADSLSKLYPTMSRIIYDYTDYQVNPSKPVTSVGKRMFEVGKNWALPALDDLKTKLGDKNLKPYFPFLGTRWKENISRAPEILNETLKAYEENTPMYEINL
jgi:hypothetical protein